MVVTVGHTPDADDAFMYYAIATGKVKSRLKIKHIIADIETLNKRALNHELDVTAVSAHAYGYLKDYVILKTGGSFGLNYGPIVIARQQMTEEQLRNATIAIPGKLTSANLLLKLAIGNFREKEVLFETIPEAVLSGEADAGLVIHEAQVTYDKKKFVATFDVGRWWSSKTGGLPVPLGVNIASTKSMTKSQIEEFSELFARSITYGLKNVDEAVQYAMQYGRGQPKDAIEKFVKMYVNDLTIDIGKEGRRAIETMFAMAKENGIMSHDVRVLVA